MSYALQCVTPPHLSFSSNTPATMPAASALAAATVTARLSALDALTQLPVSGVAIECYMTNVCIS